MTSATTNTTQDGSTTSETTEKLLAVVTVANNTGKPNTSFLSNLNLSGLSGTATAGGVVHNLATSLSAGSASSSRLNLSQSSTESKATSLRELQQKALAVASKHNNTSSSTITSASVSAGNPPVISTEDVATSSAAENAVVVAAQTILAQVLSEGVDPQNSKVGEQGEQSGEDRENTYIEIPLNVVLEAAIDAENAVNNDGGENDQKPQQATTPIWKKKANTTSLQLDGFDLVNIENPHASLEELEAHAREVLSSFRRKRVRFPNGAAKLPQDCFFCLKRLSNRKKLREHQFSVHFKNVGEFMCGICKQRFVFGRQLKAHMLVHSDNRNFQCEFCGLTCKRRSHLHKHIETHNKERNYRYVNFSVTSF